MTLPPTGFAVENRGAFVGVVCVGLAAIVTPVLVVPKFKLELELDVELEAELVVVDVLGIELVVEG